jgi:hypothetical protein
MHGLSMLPAWPVRVACEPLNAPINATTDSAQLLTAVKLAVSVYYNNTGAARCFFNGPADQLPQKKKTMLSAAASHTRRSKSFASSATASCGGDWDYQWCTEIVQPFSSGTGNDMVLRSLSDWLCANQFFACSFGHHRLLIYRPRLPAARRSMVLRLDRDGPRWFVVVNFVGRVFRNVCVDTERVVSVEPGQQRSSVGQQHRF